MTEEHRKIWTSESGGRNIVNKVLMDEILKNLDKK